MAKMKVGDPCTLCNTGQIKENIYTVGESSHKSLQCDVCAARYCAECGGTLNVRASSCVYKDQCFCEAGEELLDKSFVLSDEDLEEA